MKPSKRYIEDGGSANGSVNTVKRRGEVVLRPMGRWSKSIHELLVHLERIEFKFSPRFLGVESEKERLSYLHGDVCLRPWTNILCTLDGLEQIAQMLKKYHEAVKGFHSETNKWHLLDREIPAGSIIRHGDLGPWNMVWKNGKLVGVIDWDFAEPGTILEDVAQAAWQCIPLKNERRTLKTGVFPEDQSERLEFFCKAYGVAVEDVLTQVKVLQKLEVDRMNSHGKAGVEPWATFYKRGDVGFVKEDSEWLEQRYFSE